MNNPQEFYHSRHTTQFYAGGNYNLKALLALKPVREWLNKAQGQTIKILDVGCGKGIFLRDFFGAVRSSWDFKQIDATGVDIVRSPSDVFSEICKDFKFVQLSVDGQTLPFPDQHFDFVCCNHVLEHIFETEKLLREFRRILRPDGICIISVPNIACWYNRVMFLFGGQPVSSEIGTELSTYGLWPKFLQKKAESWQPSGHIRSFTPRGFQDLVRHCGFAPAGWWKQGLKLQARFTKWSGLEMGLVLRPDA